jgi:hypothetical protein
MKEDQQAWEAIIQKVFTESDIEMMKQMGIYDSVEIAVKTAALQRSVGEVTEGDETLLDQIFCTCKSGDNPHCFVHHPTPPSQPTDAAKFYCATDEANKFDGKERCKAQCPSCTPTDAALEKEAEERYPLKTLRTFDSSVWKYNETQEALREAFIAGRQSREQEWISVESGNMPKIPQPYFSKEDECMVEPLDVTVLVTDGQFVWAFNYWKDLPEEVTHWQPLPAPPSQPIEAESKDRWEEEATNLLLAAWLQLKPFEAGHECELSELLNQIEDFVKSYKVSQSQPSVEAAAAKRELETITHEEINKIASILLGKETVCHIEHVGEEKDFWIAWWKEEPDLAHPETTVRMGMTISNIGNPFRIDHTWKYINNKGVSISHEPLHNSHAITKYLIERNFNLFKK